MITYETIVVTDAGSISEPVTLAEVKAWLNIDHSDHDNLLESMLVGARQTIEGYTNRALVDKEVTLNVETGYDSDKVKLPYGGITGLVITDSNESTVTSDYYTLRSNSLRFIYSGEFEVSYSVVANVPQALKEAILMEVAERYAHRGENHTTEGISEGAKSKAFQYVDIWL